MAAGYGVSEPDAVKEGKREVWGRETRTRQGKIESGKKGISKIGPGGKEREMVGREGGREVCWRMGKLLTWGLGMRG